MKVRLPDRHDVLLLAGASLVVYGVYQVLPWLAFVVAGLFLGYIAIATERPE